MDPQFLRTFVAVVRLGSFSAAARHLGYTQSAVSQQIATLESDLGTVLLNRRPVAPTEAGERLLEHAAAILLRLDAARADVQRAAMEPPGHLIVVASPVAAHHRLTHALTVVRRSHPALEVTLRIAGREAVMTGIASGEVTIGLIDGVAAPSDPLHLLDIGSLTPVAVAEEPLAVLLPIGHPLARRAGVRLADLADARWIDSPDVGAPLPDLRAAAETDGLRAAMHYDGTDTATLIALVAAGHGLTVLPAPLAADGVSAVPLISPRLVHRTELLHSRLAGSATTALAAALTSRR